MVDHQATSAHAAKGQDAFLSTKITRQHAPSVEDSATCLPGDECYLCHGSGVMRWTQMCPDGVLRELEHPCIHGCSGYWKQPAAEERHVVNLMDAEPISNAAGEH